MNKYINPIHAVTRLDLAGHDIYGDQDESLLSLSLMYLDDVHFYLSIFPFELR